MDYTCKYKCIQNKPGIQLTATKCRTVKLRITRYFLVFKAGEYQTPRIYNYTRSEQTALLFYCSLGNKVPFVHFNQTHKPGEGHVCLILKRINRMVCLEDRKTVPMAGRGRKWRKERARENDGARKMEQIQKLCELEEVKDGTHPKKSG